MSYEPMSTAVEYTGKFSRCIFQNDDASYCVNIYSDKKGKFTTVVGANLPRSSHMVTFLGVWKDTKKYGIQFIADTVLTPLPTEKNDIVEYLSSLRVGIGKKRGRQMLALTGPSDFWEVLDTDPSRFYTISGINEDSIARLKKATSEMRLKTDLVKMFAGKLQMTDRHFNRIRQKFNGQLDILLDLIRENPYCLAKAGWSYEELDNYAKTFPAYDPYSTARIGCALNQLLLRAEESQHTCYPIELAAEELRPLLNRDTPLYSCAQCLDFARAPMPEWEIQASMGMLYRNVSYDQEVLIADRLIRYHRNRRTTNMDFGPIDHSIFQYEQQTGIILAPEQRQAIRNVFAGGVCVITGGPGTGKSTILAAVLWVWKAINRNEDWILLSPTGRASRRMSETTGQGAYTIHSAARLRVDDGSEGIPDTPPGEFLTQSLYIVDESSMADQATTAGLLQAITNETPTIVFVGDVDQLPSVGAGNVFADIIASNCVSVTRLTHIFRQAAENPIVANAAKIRQGQTDLLWTNTFRRFMYPTEEENASIACQLYCTCAQRQGINSVILLTPYRDSRHIINANKMNLQIQDMLNPLRGQGFMESSRTIDGTKMTFREGDRVMQIRNTDTVKNGDIGTAERIAANEDGDRVLVVLFETGERIEYTQDELKQLDLAYAMTVHKAQGSEYKTVMMLLPYRASSFIRRNIFYTGITRARENLFLFSPTSTVNYAITNDQTDVRYTGLAKRLTTV